MTIMCDPFLEAEARLYVSSKTGPDYTIFGKSLPENTVRVPKLGIENRIVDPGGDLDVTDERPARTMEPMGGFEPPFGLRIVGMGQSALLSSCTWRSSRNTIRGETCPSS